MRVSDVVSFFIGYCVTSAILYMLPVVTMYPAPALVYRDDDGVCYTYDREDVTC